MSPRFSIRLLATQPDDRLIALAREGHERAFEALVRRYRRALLRYCQSMRLSDARAEDVVQQALMKAWLALAGGAEVREPRAWLYRIVHNTAVNTIRAAREVPTEPAGVLRERATIGESELERKLDVQDALGHVAALPQMQRDAVLLTAVDGQSHGEVAVALGVSQGAVRGLLYRARTTLRGATAALTPTPLLEWAARGAGSAAPSVERIAELTGSAGAAGIAGVLVKGAAVAVSVGALATGVAVKLHHGAGDRARAGGDATRTVAPAPATVAASIGRAASRPTAAGGAPAHERNAGRHSARRGRRLRKSGSGAAGGAPPSGGHLLLADTHPGAPVRSSGPSFGGGVSHEGRRDTGEGRERDRSSSDTSEAPASSGSEASGQPSHGGSGDETAQVGAPTPAQPLGYVEPGAGSTGSAGGREQPQGSATSSDDSHNDGEEPTQTQTTGPGSGEHADDRRASR